MKIVINKSYGVFALSNKGMERLSELSHQAKQVYDTNPNKKRYSYFGIADRNDPNLIQVFEELGQEAYEEGRKYKIVEIPDDVDWIIKDYDGKEWVAERHRTWR